MNPTIEKALKAIVTVYINADSVPQKHIKVLPLSSGYARHFRLSANAQTLVSVIRRLDVSVKWMKQEHGFWGFYDQDKSEVYFASADTIVIAHELAHIIHCRYEEVVTDKDVVRSEKIAELTAAVLCQLLGEKGYETESIAFFDNNLDTDIIEAMADTSIMGMVERVVGDIFTLARLRKAA